MSVQQLDLPMARRGRSTGAMRARLTGAALSVAWHLGLLAALVLLVATPLSPRIEPAVDVVLVPPFTIPRLALPRPLTAPRGGSTAALRSAPSPNGSGAELQVRGHLAAARWPGGARPCRS